MGFLMVVKPLVVIVGWVIGFFEIAFVVVQMLSPVAERMLPRLLPRVPRDAIVVWFGVQRRTTTTASQARPSSNRFETHQSKQDKAAPSMGAGGAPSPDAASASAAAEAVKEVLDKGLFSRCQERENEATS